MFGAKNKHRNNCKTAIVTLQDFHTRVDGAVSGEDLAELLARGMQKGQEQEDIEGADRAAESAVRKLEIKVSFISSVRSSRVTNTE